ncbi:MAG: serine hydrolase domain-containing protein [Dehalococcoidia bacterium]
MPDVNQQVHTVLEGLIADGLELGAQVAAYLDGELVVDTWAGLADKESGRAVDGDSLFTVFSTTKGPTATCIHVLAERGLLKYDAPIARYWPEFAAHGKEEATVRDALTHRAGVPQLPADITPAMMCDWEGMCRLIAESEPLWEPGTKTGYHAYTFGWILGEMLRRIDGRPIAEFLQQEICRPLAIASL